MSDERPRAPKVVGLGEVLWDVFPNGALFGGAPANFACQAAALGAEAYVVSAVGNDPLGKAALGELLARRVQTDFLQIDNDHLTGTVQVTLDDRGQASYEFASDTAWDHLEWNAALVRLAAECDAVCFGTLAQRSRRSRETIEIFLRSTGRDCLRIFDVNLRQTFYTLPTIEASLGSASVLKLNDHELPIVSRLLGAPTSTVKDTLRWLSDRYGLRWVALTRGAEGSLLYDSNGSFDDQLPPKVEVVDTVGAGDAFTAALAVGLLRHEALASIHRFASELAAHVCTQPGATPLLPR